MTLEEWMENPPDLQEWVDGELLEKNGITLKHSKVQGNLYYYWRTYKDSSGQGGVVSTQIVLPGFSIPVDELLK
jgi:hypothetical protein